ncbi:MAG: alanine/glycine:cation symporter family protein [Limisphaerales bacterium]
MIETLTQLFGDAATFVWTYVVVGLCLMVGLYCTFRTRFVQFSSFIHAIGLLVGKYPESEDEKDGITTFQALSTALSSTVGIGNIAGVAVAIKTGGPGAIFWMWFMALIGMALKFAEGTLGSLYRQKIGADGEKGGGPMYYITKGLGERWKPVAVFYSVCTAVGVLGAWNMFQSNQAAAVLHDQMSVPPWVTGLVLTVFAGLVLIGGIKRIGTVASMIVPPMCVIYVITVMVICVMNLDRMPAVFGLIFHDAFQFDSVGGGVLGTAVLIGIRRALFSNEAGTGTAGIAHAAAHTAHPVRQGIVSSLGPFIDTIVVCGATASVILLSGFYGTESYQNTTGTRMSFEKSDGLLIWTGVPADESPLQSFMDGERVIAVSGTQVEFGLGDLARTNISGVIGIRLSAWYEKLVPEIILRDDSSREVLSGADGIEGVTPPRQWGSWVMKLEDDWLQRFADDTKADNLKLVVDAGASGQVYLDRVELVSQANGIVLSTAAFSKFFGVFASFFIPIAALLFAYSTVIAGNYYGEVSCHYLSEKLVKPYLWLYIIATYLGCAVNLDIVINFSDLTVGLMALPNLIAVALLLPIVIRQTRDYFGGQGQETKRADAVSEAGKPDDAS